MNSALRSALGLAVATIILCVAANPASAGVPAAGVVTWTDAVFAGQVSGPENEWAVVAYHLPDGGGTRVFVADTLDKRKGLAPFDDVIVGTDALTLTINGQARQLNLKTSLPILGTVELTVEHFQVDSSGVGCQGTIVFDFQSRSHELTKDGSISGFIGGQKVSTTACMGWGGNAFGGWTAPPIG